MYVPEGTALAWTLRTGLEASFVFVVLWRILPQNMTALISSGLKKAISA